MSSEVVPLMQAEVSPRSIPVSATVKWKLRSLSLSLSTSVTCGAPCVSEQTRSAGLSASPKHASAITNWLASKTPVVRMATDMTPPFERLSGFSDDPGEMSNGTGRYTSTSIPLLSSLPPLPSVESVATVAVLVNDPGLVGVITTSMVTVPPTGTVPMAQEKPVATDAPQEYVSTAAPTRNVAVPTA